MRNSCDSNGTLQLHRVPVLAGGGGIGTGYAAPYMMEGTPSPMYYTQPATQLLSFRPTGLVFATSWQGLSVNNMSGCTLCWDAIVNIGTDK